MTEVQNLTKLIGQLGFDEPTHQPGSYPEFNPVDVIRNYITEELHKLSNVDKSIIFPALDCPNTLDKGDLIVPIPRLRIKGANPANLAKEWAENFPKGNYLEKVESQGPFIQFFISKNYLTNVVLKDILIRNEHYGELPLGEGKKVIVEFSSPNIAKPFHAGHLRSTIIGGFLSNLYEKLGWNVFRLNYLGDWGKQFGVLAVGFERYGSQEKLSTDPINHLFEVYVKINKDITEEKESSGESQTSKTDDDARAFFRRMEDGDPDAIALWKKFRELSIEKYIDTYARLNIKYDLYGGESVVSKDSMDTAIESLEAKKLVFEDKGAKLIDLKPFNKKLGKVLVEKSDGTRLYMSRDIAGAVERYEKYKFDKMIYVIASQQDLHTAQFFEILKLLDYPWAKDLVHVNFGLVQGMSTRKGTVVFLDTILEETQKEMLKVMQKNEAKYAQIEDPEKIADLIGISAVMIQDMSGKRINNYHFSWDRMLSFEGDTGPYLQYAHSRLSSVARNAKVSKDNLQEANTDLLVEDQAFHLIRLLSQYPDVLARAIKNHEPSTIVTYLFKLTHVVSSCYDVLWVAGQAEELATARLALYVATRNVINNGMRLLGLTPVERM
ncbi:arginine--tRNA ligase [Saccharomycopsis crataegensis]|uniref:arginine--tRNA ligase n=1 Tax=Saccharomycopsis crataegensis TaxID=43959 RepID=A0AAV5QK22_9ASCO|nr:arginine--tRNA ligase [Saccharomycopsis crataegensis]